MLKKLFVATCVALATTYCVNAAEPVAPPPVLGQQPGPRVIVRDACAWPNLTVLRDGTLVATIFNQPSHGSVEGDVECWGSHDQGQTWQKLGVPAVHEPHTNRMNVAAGLAANGDLVVISSGWSDRYPAGQSGPPLRAHVLPAWICRSSDGGTTWTVDRSGFPVHGPRGGDCIPFGDIAVGHDGMLRVAIYEVTKQRDDRVWIFRSPDDGRSWEDPVAMDSQNTRNETALLHLGQGHWLAASRENGLYLYTSIDDGRTWGGGTRLTDAQQHPGHLLRLHDGRVLLTYGNRVENSKGVDVRWSNDQGATWSNAMRVVDFSGDGGYPSSVQLPGGQIVTAYYARQIASHEGYHMGIVVWDAEASMPKRPDGLPGDR